MKYFYEPKDPKDEEGRQEISEDKAKEFVEKHYSNPEYVLEHAERLLDNRIGLTFGTLIIEE